MTVLSTAPRGTAEWKPAADAAITGSIGLSGRPQNLVLTAERRDALRRSLGHDLSDSVTTLADFCPDPLVLALESGLPRVRVLGKVVDGGSEWSQLADVVPGSLVAASRIVDIAERVSSSGRRMMRTTYETEFRNGRGALIGIARGFSIDMEEANR